MSIQFDLKETRLAHCTFHFAQGMILIETTSDLSLVFMRGWKFVEISISTNFNRIRAIYIITAAGTGLTNIMIQKCVLNPNKLDKLNK